MPYEAAPTMAIPGYDLIAPVCEAGDLVLYRAIRAKDGLPVLLKFPAAPGPSPVLSRCLENEFELARDPEPRCIARALALVHHAGTTALVLEQGPTKCLSSLLGSPMEIQTFLKIAIGITDALAELHHCELIHKDIKPEHVLLDEGGRVWLSGLGVASRLPRERQAPEAPEIIDGTLAYMAPEQTGRMNRSIDSRSDLYALGISFYQMLTGMLPFTASDPMEWVHCHIARQPLPPIRQVASVPETLSEMVMKLLAKTAEERYQSAGGLAADLRRCQAEWGSTGCIARFPLGEHEVSQRLLIAEKLYGRRSDIDTLLAAFDRVTSSGTPEVVLVSGDPGVGKTSVVHELLKALVPLRGLFGEGKFDQYKRDIPYATLVQAIHALIRHLLGKSKAEVAEWRDVLQKAVSPNGQLIVDLIPEVELIIGIQPAVPDLPPQEAQNRFQMVLRRFLRGFTGPDHPLVLFLDDLQWLDAATLELLNDIVMGAERRYLLLIGAYRDNEVGPTHPLMRFIETMHRAGTSLREIVLAPLAIDDVGELIADAIHCERQRTPPLAQLVHEKTGGNPFFVNQFLSALGEEKLLIFDSGAGRWTWDLFQIRAKGFTDNVVDLMLGKLNRLQAESQETIKQLACLGSEAGLATLAQVQHMAAEEVEKNLLEAIHAGFLLRQDESVSFLHDRVQEAAYALIPEEERPEVHLNIGRTLLAQTGPEELNDILFDVANHLNRGAGLINDPAEKDRLAELNIAAGKRARASIAYKTARDLFAAAAALLPEGAWDSRYDFMFALYLDWAEAEYLQNDFEKAERLFAILLAQAKSDFDKAVVYKLRLTVYPIAGKYDEAVDMGIRALQLFGEEIPEDDDAINRMIEEEAAALRQNLQGREIAELTGAPEVTDPQAATMIEILTGIGGPAYIGSRPQLYPLFVLMELNNVLKYGITKEACHAFSGYAILQAISLGDLNAAYAFSQAAVSLSERFGGLSTIGSILYLHGNHVNFWLKPFATDFPILERGFHACQDGGDLAFANYIAYSIVWQAVERGDTIDDVLDFSRKYAGFAMESRNEAIYQSIVLEQQFLKCLMGKTDGDASFSDEGINELSCVAEIEKAAFTCGLTYYHTMKTFVAYLMGDDAAARTHAEEAGKLRSAVMSQPMQVMFYFLHALVLTRACREGADDERKKSRKILLEYRKKLAFWSENCPENFASKHALVAAEIAEIEGDELTAEQLFEQATEAARTNGFFHWEAMANEAAARFHRDRGLKTLSRAYLREAHACYARWGAQGKLRQLEQTYPQLRAASPRALIDSAATGTQALDILAVTRASQAISGEILLDNLLKILLRIVLENAGAQKGYLLLTNKQGLSLVAESHVEKQHIVVHVHGETGVADAVLPTAIINYVRRSRAPVLLDDTASPNPYSADKYFTQRQPKSVLCFPITNQSRLIGVLYLENDLATHAFTSDRLAVLKLIAAQAAVSLENARVYEDLRESEQRFRVIFDQTFQFIGVLSIDGIILQANQTGLKFAGVSEVEVLGKLFWETPWWTHSVEMQERVRTAVKEAARGKLVRFEATHSTPDGEVHYIDFSLKPVIDTEGRVIQLIPEGRDITERKQAEEEISRLNQELEQRVADRTAELEAFSYSVSHDLRTPLRAIDGFSHILLSDYADHLDDEGKRLLNVVRGNVSRMGQLIDDILQFSRAGRLGMTYSEIDMERMAREVFTELQSITPGDDNQQFEIEPIPPAWGDRSMLRQVFVNLLGNAIKFNRNRELPRIKVGATADDGETIYYVSDNGVGFDMQYADKLFGVFERLHGMDEFEGTGIGLAIVKRIITRHAGRVWAEGKLNEGATFYFSLPRSKREEAAHEG